MSCGFYSILATFKGHIDQEFYVNAAWGILAANIFDFLDGWIARLTNSSSRFGTQLDSLSDLIAFSVAPAVLVYSFGLNTMGRVGWGASFFFIMCGALRLARYNVQMDTRESKAFTGMPTPGAATVVASFVLFYYEVWNHTLVKNYFAITLTFALALLMVSTIRYHSLKELDLKRRKPFRYLIIFATICFLIVSNPPVVIFISSALYMISGPGEWVFLAYKKKRMKKSGNNPKGSL
jgi:CDP-diacylglycerol--serine O-phosphatidyltransferase